MSPVPLMSSQWQLLIVTFNMNQTNIYIDGSLKKRLNISYLPKMVSRNKNYIGKSNWPRDGVSDSLLDDLRFYNKSLNQTEILDLYLYNQETRTYNLSSNAKQSNFHLKNISLSLYLGQ